MAGGSIPFIEAMAAALIPNLMVPVLNLCNRESWCDFPSGITTALCPAAMQFVMVRRER